MKTGTVILSGSMLLACIGVGTSVHLDLLDYSDEAVFIRARRDIATMKDACSSYRQDVGRLPFSTTELIPDYIAASPNDPWTNAPYYWLREAETLRIVSLGKDRRSGGDCYDADIVERIE